MKRKKQSPNRDNTYKSRLNFSKTSNLNQLIAEQKFSKALNLIDEILKIENDYKNWNLKAIILDNLSRYDESIECYDKSLMLHECDEVKTNKANTLYKYAKVSYFPDAEYEKALDLINKSLEIHPEGEDLSEFYFLKAEILEDLWS